MICDQVKEARQKTRQFYRDFDRIKLNRIKKIKHFEIIKNNVEF